VELLDAHNSKAACLATCWTITIPDKDVQKSVNAVAVAGTAVLHSHYSEGTVNLQLRCHQPFQAATAGTEEEKVNSIVAQMEDRKLSYEQKVARAVVDQIAAHETAMYAKLSTRLEEASDLKTLRRILPITKTRFKWDAAAQKQVKLLNDRKTT
jgi:hypothetical protein